MFPASVFRSTTNHHFENKNDSFDKLEAFTVIVTKLDGDLTAASLTFYMLFLHYNNLYFCFVFKTNSSWNYDNTDIATAFTNNVTGN